MHRAFSLMLKSDAAQFHNMARAKFGAVVTDIRGKLGGHVFQGNGFTTSIRTGYSGKGGLPARSSVFTSMNNDIDELWAALSDTQKNAWDSLATQYPIIDNFANQNFLTGRNLHRRNYTAFFSSGQTGTIDPSVAVGDLPSSNLEHVQFNFSNEDIDVQFAFDRFSQAVIVYGQPVTKFGLSIQAEKLPFIYGENDETPQDDLLWDAFFAKYPDFQENSPCQFAVVQVNQYGFSSFRKTVYGIFV